MAYEPNDFGYRDALPSGNPEKVIKGSDFDIEFNAIKDALDDIGLDAGSIDGLQDILDEKADKDALDQEIVDREAGDTELDQKIDALTTNDLADVNSAGATKDQFLIHNGSEWVAKNFHIDTELTVVDGISVASDPAPSAENGDIYINNEEGVAGASWIGIAGAVVNVANAVGWSERYSRWYLLGDVFSDSLWEQSGSDIYYADGKVGVGTESPEVRLHVKDDLSTIFQLESAFPSTWMKWLNGNSTSPGYIGYEDGDNMTFWTAGASRMTIDAYGVVSVNQGTLDLQSDGSSSYTNSRILLNAEGSVRGAGVFSHNTANSTEWFYGNPYDSPDSFVISRVTGSAHQDSAAIDINALVTVDNAGHVNVSGDLTAPFVSLSASSTSTNLVTNSGAALHLTNTSATDGNFSNIGAYNSNGLVTSQIDFINTSHSARTGEIALFTHDGASMTEAMRIDASGKVGIGTDIPFSKVDIKTSPTSNLASNESQLALRNGDGRASYLTFDNSADLTIYNTGSKDGSGGATVFEQTSGEAMRIDATGNVGIGCSPAYLLQLNEKPTASFGTPMLQVGGSDFLGGGYYSIGLGYSAGGSAPPAEIAAESESPSGSTTADIVFGTRTVTSGTAVTERMRITADGRVGIGGSPGTRTAGEYLEKAKTKMAGWKTTFDARLKAEPDASTQEITLEITDGDFSVLPTAEALAERLSERAIGGGTAKLQVAGDGYFVGTVAAGGVTAGGYGNSSPGMAGFLNYNGSPVFVWDGTQVYPNSPSGMSIGTSAYPFANGHFSGTIYGNVDDVPSHVKAITQTQIANWDAGTGGGSGGGATTDGRISDTQISNWDQAHGWGNHASAGYQPAGSYETAGTAYTKAESDGKYELKGAGGGGLPAGDWACTGSITAVGNITAYSSSDERLKDDITAMPVGLIDSISPVTWKWKEGGKSSGGVVAQQLQACGLDDWVNEAPNGDLGVDYNALIGMLIAEVKSLKAEIAEMK